MSLSFPVITRRRVFLLLAAFVVAAVGTVGVIADRPAHYTAIGSVFLSQVYPGNSDSSAAFEVSDFQAAATLPGALDATSKATGESPGALKSGLGATQEGQSAVVSVTYTSSSPDQASKVVRLASQSTVTFLAQQDLSAANVAIAAAKTQSSEASTALAAFQLNTNFANLDASYNAGVKKLLALEKQASTSPKDPALPARIKATKADIVTLNRQRSQRDQVEGAVAQAAQALTNAQAQQAGANAELQAAGNPSLVVINSVDRVSRIKAAARGVVGAALVVLVLGLALMALIDSRGRIHRDRFPRVPPTSGRVKQPAGGAEVEVGYGGEGSRPAGVGR
jgi:hypothetical protein